MTAEPFELFAELSLALIGFAGVAASFAGRDRDFSQIDRIRLLGVITPSSLTLFGAILIPVLQASHVEFQDCLVVVSLFAAVVQVALACSFLPQGFSVSRNPETTSESWTPWVFSLYYAATAVAYVVSALAGGLAGIVLANFAVQLAISIWAFWRLLTRGS